MEDRPDEQNEQSSDWASILADRSTEGRAIVEKLKQAEQTVLALQNGIAKAMDEGRDFTAKFTKFEAAMAEVDRLRKEVYRIARQ